MGPPRPQGEPAPDEWMRRLGALPLVHQPGAQWMYDTASDALSVLIARVAGQPLETFLRERIFGPLGMHDTGFSVPAAKLSRFATSYGSDPASGGLTPYDEPVGGQWSRPPALGRRRPRVDGRRLPGVRSHAARRRPARGRPHPVAALGRGHDHRSAHRGAEGALRLRPRLLGRPRLGLRVSIVTRRTGPFAPGRFGWDGGLGTSWRPTRRRTWSASC